MRYIIEKDSRVSVRGSLLFLPRGWIVTNDPPPRRPGWGGAMLQTGVIHLGDDALSELVKSGTSITEIDESVPMEQCPHCHKNFVSNFAPPPGAEQDG